ncbi:uncharacterized protein TRIADDRAFT_62149 [Trichoplax adhaerens]|uniref:Major facilitator superfamily (MFS) profile domain-containing protein n=1 Tax=Trichoplax adhaerens TaxID=10228 RepID=B3SCZ3_TRIAD|nr:hypothetical protein TRIADDRAFT_62149 [Trichoplax adhaerens]EDV19406.1 hypothetical protein TRIADDRAFT_62149 [Trichoplax adhaerens]|eukprot:XP_002118095.1 hypothetical protein TRIADDRAFT_62149 [Trichoplax adhaerens]
MAGLWKLFYNMKVFKRLLLSSKGLFSLRTFFLKLDQRPQLTIADAVESIGFGKFQWHCMAFLGSIWFARTMQIAMLSLLGPLLVCEWGISTTEEALITGAFTFLGIAVEGILAYVLLKAFNWRILLFVTTALYLIPILLSSFIVESPRYLLLQEFKGEVSKIIEDAARLNNRPTPNGNLVANFEQSDGKFKDLFKPAYIRTTINLWLITFCMITIYFGAVWVTPLLAKVDSCNSKQGATGIRCHCKEMGPANIIAIIISGLGEPFGVIIICKNWSLNFVRYAFILLTRSCACFLTDVPFIYTSEIYPTKFRAIGLGSATSFSGLGNIFSSFIGQALFSVSNTATLATFAGIAAIAVICSLLIKVETKGTLLKVSF